MAMIVDARPGLDLGLDEIARAEAFHRYFPGGAIEALPPSPLLPPEVLQDLAGYAEHTEGKDFPPQRWDAAYGIHHADSGKTFALQHPQIDFHGRKALESTYLVDVDSSGQAIGTGFVRYIPSDESGVNYTSYVDKPFVGTTRTYPGHERQGLGTRRLFMMNAVSQMLYARPLNSSEEISPDEIRIWERLVSEGVATPYEEDGFNRYVFNGIGLPALS